MAALAPTLPTVEGTVTVDGLDREVEIRRDRWGIPHVVAATVPDLFFGQGFAAAQDRLWQVELDRRRYQGRVAEVLDERFAVADVFARRAGLATAAEAGFAALDDETQAILVAHAAGLNAFLASDRARPVELQELDVEPEPFLPWDAVGAFVGRHVTFATWQTKLWRARVVAALGADGLVALMRGAGSAREVIVPPPPSAARTASTGEIDVRELEAGVAAVAALPELRAHGASAARWSAAGAEGAGDEGGSNSWVLHGSRTASGRPLLAGDPHRPLELPNVYYQVHLVGPGIDVAGLAFPAVPGVPHFGQTGAAAWGITNAGADYQDLFVERIEPDGDGWRYQGPDGWRPCTGGSSTVAVRGGDPIAVEVLSTEHGPAVIGDPRSGTVVTLRSVGLLEPGGSLRSVLPLARAGSAEEVLAAFASWVEPANSVLAADRSGAIAYHTAGRIPIRPAVNFWLPVPGWTGGHEWQGTVGFEALPAVTDPDAGFVVTANNRITATDAPHRIGVTWAGPHRARRVRERIEALAEPATVEHMATIQLDAVSYPSRNLAERVARLDPGALATDGARRLHQLLSGWHGEMRSDSLEAGVVAAVRGELIRRLLDCPALTALRTNPFADEPPASARPAELRLNEALGRILTADLAALTGDPADRWDDLLLDAVNAAATRLEGGHGPEPAGWAWGARHRLQPAHPLARAVPAVRELRDRVALAVDGENDCVCATTWVPGRSEAAVTGPCARYVFDLADRDASGWIVPFGASGHPASPHAADQVEHYAAGRLLPLITSTDALRVEPGTTQTLVPRAAT